MAELEAKPFPPGRYPLIVVGSGPGGMQLTYSLGRLGVDHAAISADQAPGGMFRKWPVFQRMLSWTKPYTGFEPGSREFERHDWNSLAGDESSHRGLMAGVMDGTSYFPSRPEMQRGLELFADRTRIRVRYGCRWEATRKDGDDFVLMTSDGEYRSPLVVFAVGVAEPWRPPIPGLEHAAQYGELREVETYADKRVFIAGKQNSGFEIASGLLPWARQIILASPSATRLSVNTHSLVGVRARYVQPYEDHVLGGGVSIVDAAIDRIEPSAGDTLTAYLRRTDGAGDLTVEVDDAISATGFTCPLVDLPELGVTTVGASKLPVQTPWWESGSVPGIFFAGTIGQGSKGLQKHGVPSNSGAVHGARYNARVLARHIAETAFGHEPERPHLAPDEVASFVGAELVESPELFHQRGYLARVLTTDPEGGLRDEGYLPLAYVLDAGGPDALATTLEADGTGAIYPVLYTRIDGKIVEQAIEPDPLLRFDTADARRLIEDVAKRVTSRAG